MWRKYLTCIAMLAVALAAMPAHADKFADILSKGVIRVVVFTDVPPFSSANVKRELEGFDVDLARMVADAEDLLPLQQRLLKERRDRWIH